MARFRYRAVSRSGEIETGTLDVADTGAAAAHLQSEGRLPIRIEPDAGGLAALLATEITPRDALSAADRIAVTRSLATLTGAGLPLDRALSMTAGLGATRRVREVAARLHARVREGAALADAMDAEEAAFPALYRAVVRAGEAGAALETTLSRLAVTLEEQATRAGAVRGALIYPAFLIVTAIGSVAVLLGYVVPSFRPLLDEAGVEPPAITEAVIAAGSLVEQGWPVLLALLVVLPVAARVALSVPSLRLRWHRAALRLPVAGALWRRFETARLARLLATLLGNGVALPPALRLAGGALGNAAFAAEIARVTPEVEAGRGIAGPLREGGLLPPLALQLLEVGEQSGRLAEMLANIAAIFEDEAKRGLDAALALLTPTLTLLLGLAIAVIVSSILFALLSLNELAI